MIKKIKLPHQQACKILGKDFTDAMAAKVCQYYITQNGTVDGGCIQCPLHMPPLPNGHMRCARGNLGTYKAFPEFYESIQNHEFVIYEPDALK